MDLKELQRNWDEFGKTDPLWAILTQADKKDRRWNKKEFFQTGQEQIAAMMRQVNDLGIISAKGRCLDFGCGVGRLTQALCDYFDDCCGVDIAPSMIAQAQRFNRFPKRCRYVVNPFDDLRMFDDRAFDFIYSCIVLQHMRPEYSKSYIREFLRLLRPGGVLVFQLPSEHISLIDRYRLPDSAFRARIAVDRAPRRISPGAEYPISVRVTNQGAVAWSASVPLNAVCQIRLGNHWLDSAGQLVAYDDGRSAIPRDMRPGQEETLKLTITAPERPGHYLLELDMVQELIAWFKDKGSETLRLPIEVAASRGERAYSALLGRPRRRQAAARAEPQMEMYCVEKAEVIDWVGQHGGHVVSAQEDSFCGPEWRSFTYFVVK